MEPSHNGTNTNQPKRTTSNKSVNGTHKRKRSPSKRKKKLTNKSKSNSQKRLNTKPISNNKPNKKKKTKKKRHKKPKSHSVTLNKETSLDIDIRSLQSNTDLTNDSANESMNSLHKTHTSPINPSLFLAQISQKMSDTDLLSIDDTDIPDIPTQPNTDSTKSPFEAIRLHKLKRNSSKNLKTKEKRNSAKQRKKKTPKSKAINVSPKIKATKSKKTNISAENGGNLQYFHNYFDRNNGKPTEMNTLLDRIETDLQFIFSDNFLNKSEILRTKKVYTLSVSLHRSFIEYKLSFLLPVCKHKLAELDSMFLSIIKWFNRFKRYHRSPQISKYKQQITKLKNNIDLLIRNIESNCSIILYSLIRTKQLFLEFHKNSKLLLFWMQLFPNNELEFTQLSWSDFVANVRANQSFKKFKQFTAQDMMSVLTENYEVLTIKEFLKYVLEYDSVGGWLNDMFEYINEEIKNPHKKSSSPPSLFQQNSVVIHDEGNESDNTFDDDMVEEEESIPGLYQNLSNSTIVVKDANELVYVNEDNAESTPTAILESRTSSASSGMIDAERSEWKKTIKSLENEITQWKTENYELNEKLKNYELRLSGVKLQSKQFFSAQSKLDYHEKLSLLMKKRCSNLYQQINESLIQFSQWSNHNHESESRNNHNNMEIAAKISQIQSSVENIKKNIAAKTKIKALCNDILEENMQNRNKNNSNRRVTMWQKVQKSLQFAMSEIYSINEQLSDIKSNKNMSNSLSPPTGNNKRVRFGGRTHSASFSLKTKDSLLPLQSPKQSKNNTRTGFRTRPTRPKSKSLHGKHSNSATVYQSEGKDNTEEETAMNNNILMSPQTPQPQPFDISALKTRDRPYSMRKTMVSEPNTPNTILEDIPMFTRPQSASFNSNKKKKRNTHIRQQTYSVATLRERMEESEQTSPITQYKNNSFPANMPMRTRTYSDQDLNELKFLPPKTHLRGHTSFTLNVDQRVRANKSKMIKMRNKRKHKRFKTATLNPTLLSPNWAANIAIHNVTESFDDGVSDVISTLSNIDYTFMLDDTEYLENENYENDGNYESYVNMYPYQMNERQRFSIVDPLTILDDKMLSDLKKQSNSTLTKSEMEMKHKLTNLLREMDLMSENRLDLCDFTSGIMNVVSSYDDIMEDAELLFETMQNLQDDMGAIKIGNIVDAIMLNKDDEAALNIKKEIMHGLQLGQESYRNHSDDESDEEESSDEENDIENMSEIQVSEPVKDPNELPFKPIYALNANVIHKIGT